MVNLVGYMKYGRALLHPYEFWWEMLSFSIWEDSFSQGDSSVA